MDHTLDLIFVILHKLVTAACVEQAAVAVESHSLLYY